MNDSYDNGIGVIRGYDKDNIPEEEYLLRKDVCDVHTTQVDYDTFAAVKAKSKVTFNLLWIDKRICPIEEFIQNFLNCQKKDDIFAIRVHEAICRNILAMLDKNDIKNTAELVVFLSEIVEQMHETDTVQIQYHDGYMTANFNDGTVKKYPSALNYDISNIFLDNPLCNSTGISSKEEALRLCQNLKYITEGSKEIDALIIEEAEKENPVIAFYGSY